MLCFEMATPHLNVLKEIPNNKDNRATKIKF